MTFALWVQCLGLAIFAYLAGSIPFGLILARQFGAVDVRQTGSRNIGATNVFRTSGLGLGVLTLLGDLSKGALPVWLTGRLPLQPESMAPVYVSAIALCAFCGHLYPIYLKFKTGGKGVATAAGCFLIISPTATGIVLIFFLLFAAATNRVSVGSLAASLSLAPVVWWTTTNEAYLVCAALMAILILIRHHENIRRLYHGIEPVIWNRKRR